MNKREIAELARKGEVAMGMYLQEFNDDPKVKKLNSGEINIPQFIEQIEDSDPYKLEELYEGKYQIINEKVMIPLQGRIPPDKVKDIDKHYKEILNIYPELNMYLEYSSSKVKEGCSSCNKNGFLFNAINMMVQLGGVGRNLSGFDKIFGRIFTEKLSEKETEKQFDITKHTKMLIEMSEKQDKSEPTATTTDLAPQPFKGKGGKQSCKNCVLKHLSQALINHQESINGYPLHKWVAVGHLAEAESESIDSFAEFTKQIRKNRIDYMESDIAPNFMELIRLANNL